MTQHNDVNRLRQKVYELEEKVKSYDNRNKFFEMLIHSLPGLFYLFDDQFNIHGWNKNVEEVIEYSSEEIQSKHIFDLFEGENLNRIQSAIQKVFRTGEGVVEAELLTKRGDRIPYFFSAVSARIGGTTYLLGIGQDISERKEAEKALIDSEALYRTLAELMTEGVMMFQNYTITFVNNAFVNILEYTEPDQLIGKNVMELVSEGFGIYFRDMYEILERGLCQERYFQARWKTRKQREIWVEGRGNMLRWKGKPSVLLTVRDITNTKLKEISMQEEADNLRRENVNLRSSMKDRYRFGDIIGKSAAMQEVYEVILNAAATNANVIIYGESGTGKELVARAIHDMSSRAGKPFVAVNSAAIPENLLESEFFGYRKGAFTGANTNKEGYLDLAKGGTLFLDEVGELTPNLQAKLLRAIEGGGYSPVGSNMKKISDFRIISATNKNLAEMAKKGEIREDFYYRVHIIPISLPPLRERQDDIPLLVEEFLKRYSPKGESTSMPGIMLEKLINYDWPGNVRELQNVIQHYLVVNHLDFLHTSTPLQDIARETKTETGYSEKPDSQPASGYNLQENVEQVEAKLILEALGRHGGNKSQAAKAMGISRKTLTRKMKRFGLM